MNTNIHTTKNTSLLLRVFGFIPNTLVMLANFTRHILLLLLLFFITMYLFSNNQIYLKKHTALVIEPNGFVVNQLSGTPSEKFMKQIQGNDVPETQMRDLLTAISNAATDDRIDVLVLSPDLMWGIGLADLKELESEIEKFRKVSNKPIIAIAENMSQNQYYFANLADEIIIDPQAFMFFQGYGAYRNYYKEGLDNLGVDVHLFRVGEYKSAAEPYIRNDMSMEAKEASLHYMNDLWDTYLEGVAKKRHLTIEDMKEFIENQASLLEDSNNNMAQMYKQAGLVDQIKNGHFKKKYIAGLSSENDKSDGFRHIGLNDYLTLVEQEKTQVKAHKIAVIVAEGSILNGEQDAGSIGGVSTSAMLRKARLDPSVKAVVLRVNSGGGAAFASEQIRREVDAIKVAGKPVVASMGNVAASGGYWISMTADKIYASKATITGSIGIYGLYMTYPKVLKKIGVHTDGVGTSSWAGAFRTDKELNKDLAKLIQANIDFGYQQFISAVAMARDLDIEMVNSIAKGRVWTAKQAKDLGLIDEIGGLNDALADAAQRANIIDNYDVVWIEPQLTSMQKFFMTSLSNVSGFFDVNLISKEQKMIQQILSPVEKSLAPLLNVKNGQISQFAHCMCEVSLQ